MAWPGSPNMKIYSASVKKPVQPLNLSLILILAFLSAPTQNNKWEVGSGNRIKPDKTTTLFLKYEIYAILLVTYSAFSR